MIAACGIIAGNHCLEHTYIYKSLLQAVVGCILQGFLIGLIFSKLSKPGNRSRTIIFSKQAVISLKNGRLCVSMRVGDLRNENFVLGTKVGMRKY